MNRRQAEPCACLCLLSLAGVVLLLVARVPHGCLHPRERYRRHAPSSDGRTASDLQHTQCTAVSVHSALHAVGVRALCGALSACMQWE